MHTIEAASTKTISRVNVDCETSLRSIACLSAMALPTTPGEEHETRKGLAAGLPRKMWAARGPAY